KPVDEVAKLTPEDVLDLLGIEISPARLKCALLSLDTVSHALGERGSSAAGEPGGASADTPADAATTAGA
ncbi:MAG: hypothetical protein P4L30_06055, partial [Candidatus Limnocylindrales bacterium]|nr:hypothetical protein [Candidatus Limnocylindrales bacterium]